ncbi:hypothetical protein LOK49_LG11G00629 [Camellia lanceoleosa]|uniref:Uncharacterized protein n=1 Tax=Camellia lanceoleosa TaxID=1840588 RepID=A0ACC0FYP0_9ERIC|nr:hypothetical protein LOK49_LG11G00629 [Camellia lanceoleosa]
MADALSVIPPAVLRQTIEGIVKQLAAAGEHDKITAVINLLANEFTYSAQVNRRKGGLIGLATATVALTGEAAQHLESKWISLSKQQLAWEDAFRSLYYMLQKTMDRARSDGDYRE